MSVEVFQATPPARPYRFELLPDDAMASALELLEAPAEAAVPEELDGALERGLANALAFAVAQADEQRLALVLLSEFSALGPEEAAERLLAHRPRFKTSALSRLFSDKAKEEACHEPERARLFERLSLLAAESTDREALPRAIWHDIRAESWGAVADTRRLLGDFAGAESAFAEAERHLRAGSGTLMVRAELLVRKASLAGDLGRFEEGLRAIDQALSILRAGARPVEIARALVAKGRLHLGNRSPESALAILEEAQGLQEDSTHQGSTDRALVLAVHQNISACLCELERFDEMRRPLTVATSAVKLLARPLGLFCLRWLEGRSAAGTGDVSSAETLFQDAVEGFLGRGEKFLAARASLDLVRLYGRTRRVFRLHRLVRPLLPMLLGKREVWRRRPVTDRFW